MGYFYGTVPSLAWILNHYFYRGVHYAWLAAEFYPFRTNPNSSNPYVIYGQLYAAWAWDDGHDKVVLQTREALLEGVAAQQKRGTLDRALARRLRRVCRRVSRSLFYPVVYRVEVDGIAADRRIVDGSGLFGSHEILVRDLHEGEVDLLFADNLGDADFVRFVLDEAAGRSRTSAVDVLKFLEARCS